MFSARSFRDSKFLRNSTAMPLIKSRRRNRDTSSETSFIVSVTPTVVFDLDDLIAEETMLPERYTLPIRRKFKPKVKEVDTTKHLQYEKRTTYDSRSKDKTPKNFENFERTKFIKPILDNEQSEAKVEKEKAEPTIENVVPQITEDKSPKEVIITPRPASRLPKLRSLVNLSINDTKVEQPSKKRSYPSLSQGVRFVIANQQDVEDLITITENGTLFTIKGLDRETKDIYRLTVIAEYTKGYITGAGIYQVIIYVDDVNDNPPIFNHPTFTGTIAENSPIGTRLVLNQDMFIKDADVGENAEFTILLSGEGSSLFAIDYINTTLQENERTKPEKRKYIESGFRKNIQTVFAEGQVKPIEMPYYSIRFVGPNLLDRERESFYNLRITAKDHGGLKSEAKLSIVVSDVNDNAPMFEKIAVFKDSGIEILEYTSSMEIYYVERMDAEVNALPFTLNLDTKPITYGISMQSHQIMPLSEQLRSHIGTPRLMMNSNSTSIPGTARKAKSKRNNSKESEYPYFSIKENAEVGSSILKVTATDEDFEANAQVFYEIISETFIPNKITPNRVHFMKFFSVDRHSGEIKISKPLQAETEIRLNISAKDIGNLADYLTIRFKVSFSLF